MTSVCDHCHSLPQPVKTMASVGTGSISFMLGSHKGLGFSYAAGMLTVIHHFIIEIALQNLSMWVAAAVKTAMKVAKHSWS
jgi:hypothetical protein